MRVRVWWCRYGQRLGAQVLELTGDREAERLDLQAADIICCTPEKFGARVCMSRCQAAWGVVGCTAKAGPLRQEGDTAPWALRCSSFCMQTP